MTKADTLKYLDKLNLSVKIPKFIIITVSDWNNNKKKVIEKILNEIPSKFLAIRSSTLDEDQNDKSNAGKYESYINIYNDSSTIVKYIEKIIDSYNEFLENVDDQQILIQECIRHVDCSGVAFSFELNKNARIIKFVLITQRKQIQLLVEQVKMRVQLTYLEIRHWKKLMIIGF